jgi:hypothetical protein
MNHVELKPGRELDALIAQYLFGFKVAPGPGNELGIVVNITELRRIPHYSTDISAAWELAEHVIKDFKERNWDISFGVFYDDMSNGWVGRFTIQGKVYLSEEDPCASHPTAAYTICLAALKAKGHTLTDHARQSKTPQHGDTKRGGDNG